MHASQLPLAATTEIELGNFIPKVWDRSFIVDSTEVLRNDWSKTGLTHHFTEGIMNQQHELGQRYHYKAFWFLIPLVDLLLSMTPATLKMAAKQEKDNSLITTQEPNRSTKEKAM